MASERSSPARPPVRGIDLDPQTRCRHWHSRRDVIAIRFPCCDMYWACLDCHHELAGHAPVRRSVTDPTPAILCGVCGHQMTARDYLNCNNTCPRCAAAFNPGCAKHYPLYFAETPR